MFLIVSKFIKIHLTHTAPFLIKMRNRFEKWCNIFEKREKPKENYSKFEFVLSGIITDTTRYKGCFNHVLTNRVTKKACRIFYN